MSARHHPVARPARRSAFAGLLAAVAALALACSVPTDHSATPVEDPELLAPLNPARTVPSGVPQGPGVVVVYLLKGDQLVRERRQGTTDIEGALRALIDGRLTDDDRAAGLTTAFQRVDLLMITSDGNGLYTVDTTPLRLDGARLTLAHAQLALTAFEVPGVQGVRFSENGKRVAAQTPRSTKRPGDYVTKDDYSDIAPATTTTTTTTTTAPATSATLPPNFTPPTSTTVRR